MPEGQGSLHYVGDLCVKKLSLCHCWLLRCLDIRLYLDNYKWVKRIFYKSGSYFKAILKWYQKLKNWSVILLIRCKVSIKLCSCSAGDRKTSKSRVTFYGIRKHHHGHGQGWRRQTGIYQLFFYRYVQHCIGLPSNEGTW